MTTDICIILYSDTGGTKMTTLTFYIGLLVLKTTSYFWLLSVNWIKTGTLPVHLNKILCHTSAVQCVRDKPVRLSKILFIMGSLCLHHCYCNQLWQSDAAKLHSAAVFTVKLKVARSSCERCVVDTAKIARPSFSASFVCIFFLSLCFENELLRL